MIIVLNSGKLLIQEFNPHNFPLFDVFSLSKILKAQIFYIVYSLRSHEKTYVRCYEFSGKLYESNIFFSTSLVSLELSKILYLDLLVFAILINAF